MSRLATIVLLLATVACDSSVAVNGGTEGDDAGTSTGEVPEGESSEGGDEESSTGEPAGWEGETLTLRTVSPDPVGWSCDSACGASECLTAWRSDVQTLDCDQADAASCACGDDADLSGLAPTHGVSECFTDPNSASGDSVEPWSGKSCDSYCSGAGLGACAWSQWVEMTPDVCPGWGGNAWVRQYGEDMTVRAPFDGEGVLRFVCEL